MQVLRSRFSSLVAGLALGIVIGSAPRAQPANAAPPPASRVVVGLKDPVTPKVLAEIRRVFAGRVLNVAPSGSYVLVLLRPGETLASVQARSPRIAWVEPEVPMGIAKQAQASAVLIPAPRAKQK